MYWSSATCLSYKCTFKIKTLRNIISNKLFDLRDRDKPKPDVQNKKKIKKLEQKCNSVQKCFYKNFTKM